MAKIELELLEKLFDAKLAPIAEDVKNIKQAINGNGKPGLKQRVMTLEDQHQGITKKFAIATGVLSLTLMTVFEIGRKFLEKKIGL